MSTIWTLSPTQKDFIEDLFVFDVSVSDPEVFEIIQSFKEIAANILMSEAIDAEGTVRALAKQVREIVDIVKYYSMKNESKDPSAADHLPTFDEGC